MRSASAKAVSVLPTPLGPTIKKTPTGFLGSVRPARDVLILSAIACNAWSCPITRFPNV